jgi:hypothetical protein
MLRKKKKAPEAVPETILSDRLSFLDVIVEACQRTGRYTLIAESGDETYTVMIDRGGPFNVDGGGSSGGPALIKAASLRRGTYSVIEGWPVDRPVYQLGLDTALQGLMLGTKPQERELPPARGVDAIRNADWQKAANGAPAGNGKEPDPFAGRPAVGAPPDPFGKSARNGGGLQPFVQPAGPWLVAGAPAPAEAGTPVRGAAPDQPSPAAGMQRVEAAAQIGTMVEEPELTRAQPDDLAVAETAEAPAETADSPAKAVEARVEAIEALRETIETPPAAVAPSPEIAVTTHVEEAAAVGDMAEPADTISYLRQVAQAAKVDPEDEAPTSIKQPGRLKRRVMKGLLWTVEVEDEPDHYTLGQVLRLVGRSLGSGFALIFRPFTRPFTSRWRQARRDWRQSGEVISRQKARKTKPSKLRR